MSQTPDSRVGAWVAIFFLSPKIFNLDTSWSLRPRRPPIATSPTKLSLFKSNECGKYLYQKVTTKVFKESPGPVCMRCVVLLVKVHQVAVTHNHLEVSPSNQKFICALILAGQPLTITSSLFASSLILTQRLPTLPSTTAISVQPSPSLVYGDQPISPV